MNVYRLTRDDELMDYFSNFDVATNAAEIDAVERFEADDVDFRFASMIALSDGTKIYSQQYPQPRFFLHVNDPRDPLSTEGEIKATYRIEEIEVKEMV